MFSLLPKHTVPSFLRGVCLLALALALTGCFETKQEFTLNPDGSGKVVHESIFVRNTQLFNQTETRSLQEQMETAVRSILSGSKGVEAWRGVSYRWLPDGRIFFQGTAYFRDLSALNIDSLTSFNFELTKLESGETVLRPVGPSKDAQELIKASPRGPVRDLTEQEMALRVLEARAEFQEKRPMLTALSSMRQEVTLHLPVGPTGVSCFKKVDDRTVTASCGGPKFLAALDEVTASEEWWRKQVRAGPDNPNLSPNFEDVDFNARYFGEAAPLRLVIPAGGKPQFDYEAEVAAAKIETAALTQQLGFDILSNLGSDASQMPAKDTAPLRDLRVAAAEVVYLPNGSRVRNDKPGITLRMRGTADKKVLRSLGGMMMKATDSNGSSLLKKETKIEEGDVSVSADELSFNLEIDFPKLSKTDAASERTPALASLSEVTGYLDYFAEGPTRKIKFDLGDLKVGPIGREFEARISSVRQPSKGEPGALGVSLKVGKWRIKSVRFLDPKGSELELAEGWSSWSDDGSEINYPLKSPLPRGTRLELEVYDPLEKFRVPFSIKNVALPSGA